jgi:hypothetical protein
MNDHLNNKNFRYPNDNRELDFTEHDYPSQQSIDPFAQKGERQFYPNDNGGHYPNSNRINIDYIDPESNTQSPNSNSIWTPRKILPQLSMWHDADDKKTIYADLGKTTLSTDKIAVLEDKTGNAKHDLTQIDQLDQPSYSIMNNSNNKCTIYFDGDDHMQTAASNIETAPSFSIFIISELITIDNGADSLISLGGLINWQIQSSSTSQFLCRWNSNQTNNTPKTFSNTGLINPRIFEFIFDLSSSTLSAFVDGVLLGSTTYAVPHTNARYILFGNRARNQSPRGWVGENIIVNEAAQDALRYKIEGYLAHKWGLEQNLPSNHIYKKQTPTL